MAQFALGAGARRDDAEPCWRIDEMKRENSDPAYLEDRDRTVPVSMLKEKSAQLPPRPKPAAPSQRHVLDSTEAPERGATCPAHAQATKSGCGKLERRRGQAVEGRTRAGIALSAPGSAKATLKSVVCR
jgi:hypothetical protein